jgi:ABC-2 type transport system permease protein
MLLYMVILLYAVAVMRATLEEKTGRIVEILISSVRPWQLMLGKILPYVVVALLNIAMTVGVGYVWFGVEVAGSITLLFALSLVFLLGSLGMGILISNLSRTQMQAMYLASFIMLPSFILSGLLFPRDNMPWLAYYAGFLLPVTYFLEIVRGVMLKGIGFQYLWPWVWPMAVFSVVVFFLSVFLFRKRIS